VVVLAVRLYSNNLHALCVGVGAVSSLGGCWCCGCILGSLTGLMTSSVDRFDWQVHGLSGWHVLRAVHDPLCAVSCCAPADQCPGSAQDYASKVYTLKKNAGLQHWRGARAANSSCSHRH